MELYIHKVISYIIDLKFFKLKGEVIEMKAKKMLVLIGLLCLSNVSARAGWFSGFGNRIANGVVNTIQNNISGKVNRAVDNAMDGKVGNTTGSKTKSNDKNNQSAAYFDKKAVESKGNEVQNKHNSYENIITTTNKKGKTIPFTGEYKVLDMGNDIVIRGEEIYNKRLEVGHSSVMIDEYLAPGKYVVNVMTLTYGQEGILFSGKYEYGGIKLGYGIVVRKTISYNKGRDLIMGDNDGDFYYIEILEGTQGHLEVVMVNGSPTLQESGIFTIYKVPEYPNLPKIK